MSKILSEEEIIKTVQEKGLKFIRFIEYNGSKSIIEVRCSNNHEPYIVNFKTINRNNRKALGCPTCKSINKSITNINKVGYDYAKQFIESYGYRLLTDESKYNGISELITVQCPNGHIFDITFNQFRRRELNGHNTINKCEFCYKEYMMELAIDKCNKLGYTLLTKEYINRNMTLDIICDKGHEWHTTYENFMRNDARCLSCNNILLSINQRKDLNEVNNILNKYGYKLLSEYINNHTPMLLECPNGHRYRCSLSNFIKGRRCPICNMSSGEQEIYRVLKKNYVQFTTQYTFSDCCDIRPLPFDFYLNNYNICIEYDGEQHFNPQCFNLTQEEFLDRQYKDNIKTKYCINNNIKLIRIPYWEFNNIEIILLNELNLID